MTRRERKLSIAALKALAAHGVPNQALIAALEAEEEEGEKERAREREKQRLKKKRHRARKRSAAAAVHPCLPLSPGTTVDTKQFALGSCSAAMVSGPSAEEGDSFVGPPPMVSPITPSLTPFATPVAEASARANENKQSEEGEAMASPQSPQSTALITPQAHEIADAVRAKAQVDEAFMGMRLAWYRTAWDVQGWLNEGATAEIIGLAIDRVTRQRERTAAEKGQPYKPPNGPSYYTDAVREEIVNALRLAARQPRQRNFFPKDHLHVVEGGHARGSTDRQTGTGAGRRGKGFAAFARDRARAAGDQD